MDRVENPRRDAPNPPDVLENAGVENREAINQAIKNIDRIAQNTEFKGEKLIADYSAQELGLTQMPDEERRVEAEQVVTEAQARVQDRQD